MIPSRSSCARAPRNSWPSATTTPRSARISESEAGFSREIWNELAGLGWLGLPFASDDGGSGGGAVELAILMEAFGRHLVIEPYLATVVLGGGLFARARIGCRARGHPAAQ